MIYPDIHARAQNVIAERLCIPRRKLTLDAHFVDDLGADSLDQMEIIMALEQEFNVEIPDEKTTAIMTLRSAITYLKPYTVQ